MLRSAIATLGLLMLVNPMTASAANIDLTAVNAGYDMVKEEGENVQTVDRTIYLDSNITVPAGTTIEFVDYGGYYISNYLPHTVTIKGTVIYNNNYLYSNSSLSYVIEDGGALIFHSGENANLPGNITVKAGGKLISERDLSFSGGNYTVEGGSEVQVREGNKLSLSDNAILKGVNNPTIDAYVTCGSSGSVYIQGDLTIKSLELTNLLYFGYKREGETLIPSTLTVEKYLGGNNQVVVREGATLKFCGETFKPREGHLYEYEKIALEKDATLWFSENLKEMVVTSIRAAGPSKIIFNSTFDIDIDSVKAISYSKKPGANPNYSAVVDDNGHHLYLQKPDKCVWCDGYTVKCDPDDMSTHNWSEKPQVVTEPTCETPGWSFLVCKDCGRPNYNTRQEIPMIDHKYVEKVAVRATTSADGKIEKTCSMCGTQTTEKIAKIKKIAADKTVFVYNGKNQAPVIKVTDSAGKTLKSGTDYAITLPDKRKAVGGYEATVKFKGKYSGTSKVSYKINPKGTTISSILAISKGFQVNWKKQTTETSGYQIQYSTSEQFKDAKTATVTKNSTVTKKITKLTAKKKYYVRVRTYKTVGKTKYYSEWSAAKAVTTKK